MVARNKGQNKLRWPAEFEPQALLMLAWPDEQTDWVDRLEQIQSLYLNLIKTTQAIAHVWLLCRSKTIEAEVRSRLATDHNLSITLCEYNDTWIRDYGPLITRQGSDYILNDFQFTGWGHKYPADKDNQVTRQLYASGAFEQIYQSPITLHTHDVVLEGGAIDTNGAGCIITTSQCQLNGNRGSRSHYQIEQVLQQHLAATKTIWIDSGAIIGDDTDAHVDTLIRFIDEHTLVYQGCHRPDDPHYPALNAMKAELREKAGAFKQVELPLPSPVFDDKGQRLGATYANFILLNQSIIFPTYGCEEDAIAIAQLNKHLPGYNLYPIDARELIRQGGSLHCASLQLPL